MSAGTTPSEMVPDLSRIRTEDDTPVDNLFSECQQHLLVESLKSSWAGPGESRPFLVAANVGVFSSVKRPPVVPDVFLSLDVAVNAQQMLSELRSYFVWVFDKVPDLVIEIVSQTPGGEDSDKLRTYARMGITYYAIFDPGHYLSDEELRLFGLNRKRYERIEPGYLADVGVGLTVWEGPIRGDVCRWLRWTDANGKLIPTADERANEEQERAEAEKQRAESAEERARRLEEKLSRYAARLRDAGLNPNGE
ncbi:MAG TPA: Uma2 family endonuclease [Gemmataceae bacterium]|nr:Uma2 family endonuclease [Gemmataceae bacterium]